MCRTRSIDFGPPADDCAFAGRQRLPSRRMNNGRFTGTISMAGGIFIGGNVGRKEMNLDSILRRVAVAHWLVSQNQSRFDGKRRGTVSRLMDSYAAANLNDGATNDDPPNLILVVVVRTSLVHISPASVFLGLTRRQPAVAPTRLLSVAPSWGTLVAISVDAILVSVAALPAVIVVPIVVLVSVLVFVFVPVISHQRRRAQS